MVFTVNGTDLICQIVDRTGKELEVVHKERSREHHVHLNTAAGKCSYRTGRKDIQRFLLGHIGKCAAFFLFEKTEVDIGAAHRIVAVGSDSQFSGLEGFQYLGRKVHTDIVFPFIAGTDHLYTVYIQFENIVMRIFKNYVRSGQVLRKFDSAADIYVLVITAPDSTYPRHVL